MGLLGDGVNVRKPVTRARAREPRTAATNGQRCVATTASGERCKLPAQQDSELCSVHASSDVSTEHEE